MNSSNQYISYINLREKYKKQSHIPYEELLLTLEWQNTRQFILNRDKNSCTLCKTRKNLQVHHTYYIKNTLPWDYLDESLITLCERCHHKIHQESRIVVFEIIRGNLVDTNSQPCIKCHGVGRFPEYKHISNGICFRCRGARYEELIGKSLVINHHEMSDVDVNNFEKDNNDDENGYYKSQTKIQYYGYEPERENSWDKADRLYGIPDPRLLNDDD